MFRYAVEELDGLLEKDFTRPSQASYNPRIARVPLILITDAKVEIPAAISAAILASLDPQPNVFPHLNLSPESCEILKLIQLPWNKMTSSLNDTLTIAATVKSAALLDRLRHLHLSPQSEFAKLLEPLQEQAECATKLCKNHKILLEPFLSSWIERSKRLNYAGKR